MRYTAAALVALGTLWYTWSPGLGMTGDDAEFVVLARSIAAGEGLSYINAPVPYAATKYPPLFPLMLAPVSQAIGAMQAVVGGCFVILAVLASGYGGLAAGLLIGVNPLLATYSSQIMSEIPYAALTLGALWCLAPYCTFAPKNDTLGIKFAWGLALAVLAYYTRSAGIVLLIAIPFTVKSRQARIAGVLAAVMPVAAWSVRNLLAGGAGPSYLEQLLLRNPYYPDAGWASIGDLANRCANNVGTYWPWIIAVACLMILDTDRLRKLYVVGIMALAIVWPWPDWRFMVPLVPVMAVAWVQGLPGQRYWVVHGMLLVASLTLLPRPPIYPDSWNRYVEASQWIKRNTDRDALVSCRKEYTTHVLANRKTTVYAFGTPGEVVADMDHQGVSHVIVDNLGYPSTRKHLIPAINAHESRFKIVWHKPHPDTWVLEKIPDAH